MNPLEIKRHIGRLESLPAFPEVVIEVLHLSAESSSAGTALLDLLSTDAGLAGCVLQSAPGSGSLEQAAARLGVRGVRRAVLWHTALTLFPPETSRALDREAFWKHAFLCGQFAERIALRVAPKHADAAFPAGLLHDVGRLAFDALAPEGYGRTLEATRSQGLFALEVERRELGVDHTLMGKWLAEAWGLPMSLREAVWLHHLPPHVLDHTACDHGLVHLVALADLLAGRGIPSEGRSQTHFEERRRRVGISVEDLKKILDEVRAEPPLTGRPGKPLASRGQQRADSGGTAKRLSRYRALHRLALALDRSHETTEILRLVAESLRGSFRAQSGCCYVVQTPEAWVAGALWRVPEAPLENFTRPLHEENRGLGSVVSSLMEAMTCEGADPKEARGLRASHGLLMTPIASEGRALGQIVLDLGLEAGGVLSEDMADLMAFSETCGAALGRAEALREMRSMAEGFGTALWKQEIEHAQAIRAERLASAGKLAAGAAHEINNPLAVVTGQAQLLLSRSASQEDARALETIIQQARRASKVLNGLMQFARPTQPKLEAVSIAHALHQVGAALRDRLERRGIRLLEDYAPNLPRVAMDRRQMEQVFVNVFLNAQQALGEKGGTIALRVRASRNRKSVVIQISDTGHGIPPDAIGHVFEPFFTTRATAENTGLGLAVCHGIVESHRGSITLQSSVGEGAACTITLPALPQEQEQAAPSPATEPKPSARPQELRLSVLVAVPDEALREVLAKSLESRGYLVRPAIDGLEAMAALMGHSVQLAVIDLAVPPLNGEPVIELIRQRYHDLPIIALASARTPAEEEQQAALAEQASACIHKPFEIENFLRQVGAALQSRHVA